MQGSKAVAAHFEFPIRLMQVGTSHLSIGLMRGQFRFLREAGFDVSVVSSPGPELYAAAEGEGVQVYAVPMVREISGLADLVSLWRLRHLMQRLRPTITNVSTPKAGLLAGIASVLSRVPCRVYTLRGLRCETASGWKRWCLILAERVACRCAHRVICVSHSLRKKAMALGIADPRKFVVPASGSSNGVETDRFAPTPERVRQATILRNDLGIPSDAPVIGFVGRFTRDKGICELIDTYLKLRHQHPAVRLLLVGDFEAGDPVPSHTRKTIQDDSQIIRTGSVRDPALYYHVMNVMALPTYREGFPNTALEAQAAAKPVVTTRATGAVDAIQDGITGILVPVGDVDSLISALSGLIDHPEMARRLGSAGLERVRHEFRQDLIWKALERELLSLLQEKGLPVPRAADSKAVPPLNSPVNLASP
ncbi:MAG: glycosyltransferase family 4 protein [Acidobacteriia bacterium]|nr:glycosyltransferase family 4 protein [Terriglobia bacterium]